MEVSELKIKCGLSKEFMAWCFNKLICNAGGVVAIVDYITEVKGNARLPGIITLGYISAFDESLAMSVIA